ncbi:MAG: hypothetical protein AB7H90_05325 [Alphaproteobacteria bacterium]
MRVAVSRGQESGPGRTPGRFFVLTAHIIFSAENLWAIAHYDLFHHTILDRTPSWYFRMLRDAERAKARAETRREPYEWPRDLPPQLPDEWVLTVEKALRNPIYTVKFDTAQQLSEFEPRMRAAFAEFAAFLNRYGSRPETITWRF